jgi:CHAD domain-containing protein
MLARILERELRRVRRRSRAVSTAQTSEERDQALHDVRKAAKRLRYAAESTRPVFGGRAKKLAKRAKALQTVLGEHQDAVVAQLTLRELGVRAHLSGENGFTFGRLHALEEARADRLRREYADVVAVLPGKHLAQWLER